MNFLKKTIFLSNNDKNKGMAILALESKNGNVFGKLKMYSDYKGEYILGIKCGNNIIKQNVNLDNSTYSFLSDKINMRENIGCVILDIADNKVTPLLWGSEKKENCKSQIIESLRNSINKISSNIPRPSAQSKEDIDTYKEEDYPQNDMENNQKESMTDEENNKYLDNNTSEEYSQISLDEENINSNDEVAVACTATEDLFESSDEEIEESIDRELGVGLGKHQFYDMIADQLNELFARYPREENLCKLIENSDWVKIDTEIDNKYHVVGIIYLNDDIRYICYGVPGSYDNEPPVEMRNYSQWLPTDTLDPYNQGYWVMYQDADTGENILMN